MKADWVYRRGDIYLANLNPFKGSEQGGKRTGRRSSEQYRQPAQFHPDHSADHVPGRKEYRTADACKYRQDRL